MGASRDGRAPRHGAWAGTDFSRPGSPSSRRKSHAGPRRDADELIAEAVEAARGAGTAVVVVATTDRGAPR
ncbi:hypothetical protein [Streptomyces sp. SID161]|uniref:hypothetical protein n=1 Tax=Streptomyces sp. SID161 TaxID=2690251 RepID=UPI001928584C|nr:hypothetical protein [Streptomyces sp. SID161]